MSVPIAGCSGNLTITGPYERWCLNWDNINLPAFGSRLVKIVRVVEGWIHFTPIVAPESPLAHLCRVRTTDATFAAEPAREPEWRLI